MTGYFKYCRGFIADTARNNQDMMAIACYYKLKLAYPNSRIYHYRPQNITKRIGVSPYLISKLVPRMVSLGLANFVIQYSNRTKEEHKTLVLVTTESIQSKYKQKDKQLILISENESLKETVFRLKSLVVENYVRQQEFVRDCKDDKCILEHAVSYQVPLKMLNKINKTVLKSGEELSMKTVLSARKAKKLFGINASQYKTYKEYTFREFCWQWIKQDKVVERFDPIRYEYEIRKKRKDRHEYWYKGYLVQEYPTEIQIPYI
jgi:hypothetical protein